MNHSNRFKTMEAYIATLQTQICEGLESVDTVKFIKDPWVREEGGGGLTRVIANGSVFEKGGVNISSVYGTLSENAAKSLKIKATEFAACGLSLVIHPFSPKVPTIHMNVRYFETNNGDSWYGGGIDLTPYYPYEEDFIYFHSVMKQAVSKISPEKYPDYKEQCDSYFTITHRKEMRGVGGIFFDHLKDLDTAFDLVCSVGGSFLESYLPIVQKRSKEVFEPMDKEFQLMRRGRYVEFNLIYDRGTLFGLHTNGRVESILMSLPTHVNFFYNYQVPKGSVQEKMIPYYQPKKWC